MNRKILSNWLGRDKKIKIAVTTGFIGILLIFASTATAERKPNIRQKENTSSMQSLKGYTNELEQKLHALVTSIDGVGDAQIMVTFESDAEYVYVNQEKKNSDKTQDETGESGKKIQERENVEQTLILVDGDDGQQALLKTTIEPKVKGVVVVCTGGDHPSVQQRVAEALTTALDIEYDKVCVTKLT